MGDSSIVLAEGFLSDGDPASENIHLVAEANRGFNLGIDEKRVGICQNVGSLSSWFRSDDFLGLSHFCDLLWDVEENDGRPVDAEARAEARMLKALGGRRMASVINDYFDLVNTTNRQDAMPPEEDAVVSASPHVQRTLEELRLRWCSAVSELTGQNINQTHQNMHGCYEGPVSSLEPAFVQKLDLIIVPQDDFDAYWVRRLLTSEEYSRGPQPQSRAFQDPTHGLTDKTVAMLSARNYHPEFVFWQRRVLLSENGRVRVYGRGYIYVQTSKGPIRVFDLTDEVSLKTYFPIEVQTIDGEHLFTLNKADDLGVRKSSWITDMLRSFSSYGRP